MPVRYLVLLALFIINSATVFAQSEAEKKEYEEDYDFSWLDPDKKIYVVQNRKYTKARKFEAMVGGGLNLSGPYSTSRLLIGRGSYYFAEQFGISIVGASQSNSRNTTYQELTKVSSVLPNIRDVTSFFGGSFVWVPFYGKYNLFNQIFYIDWHVEAGVASVNTSVNLNFQSGSPDRYQANTQTGFYWGTGMKFFLSQAFAVRLDLLSLYYSAPIVRQGVISQDTSTNDNYYLTLGISAHL